MTAEKDANSPATTSMAYDFMRPKWAMIQTLLDGTDAMRSAGTGYLPMHPAEELTNYNNRLQGAVLYNMTGLTTENLTGKVFSTPLTFDKTTPKPILDLTKDIDLKGHDATRFAREWFYTAVAKGVCDILVDMPFLDSSVPRTLADDNKMALRPYWKKIEPEDVIFRAVEVVDGEERYTHVRIIEHPVTQAGFTEVCKTHILVLEPTAWYRYEEYVDPRTKKVVWRIIDMGDNPLGRVPLVTFYAGKQSEVGIVKPPMEDIAYLNITHWQSTADQRDILTVTRYPMLGVSGANENNSKQLKIGPHQVLSVKDPTGRYYFVEHTGKAVESGRQDLLDLEEQMASYGSTFLKRRPGNATATAATLNTAEATSPLQDMATQFDDSFNMALWVTAQWLKLGEQDDAGGAAKTTKDFGADEVSEQQLKTLIEARKQGDISRETFVQRLKDFGVLGEDFDDKKDTEMLKAEMALLDARAKTNAAISGRPDPNATGDNAGNHRPAKGGSPTDAPAA